MPDPHVNWVRDTTTTVQLMPWRPGNLNLNQAMRQQWQTRETIAAKDHRQELSWTKHSLLNVMGSCPGEDGRDAALLGVLHADGDAVDWPLSCDSESTRADVNGLVDPLVTAEE